MTRPSLLSNLQNAFKLLIFILSFVKCIPSFILPLSIFNSNISSISESIDNCLPLEPVENGNVEIKSYRGQTAAFITCDKNFTLVGKNVILSECVDGEWKLGFEDILPKCEKRCPPPPYLEHGDIDLEKKLEDVYSPTGSYLEGTVVTYSCNEGYILEPSASSFRICEKGQWTGADAFCKPSREINCDRPPIVENGYMQPSFPLEYSPISIGQEVLYQCLHGYKLVGSGKIKCADNGVWLPEVPSCHKDVGNPFADFSAPAAAVSNGMPDFFAQSAPQPVANQNLWGNGVSSTNAFQAPIQQTVTSSQPFNDLTGVFNTTEPSVFDPLCSVEPKQVPLIPPQPNMPPQRPPQPSKILTGDLESSLNSLVENLTMDSGSGKWSSPKNQPKTSTAAGWQPQQMATTNAASYRPMMGAQPPMMPQQTVMQQPFMGGTPQYMGSYHQQPQMMGSPKIGAPATQPQEQPAFDPFGAFECAAGPLLDPKIHARVEITSISGNTAEVACQANYQNFLAPCQSSKFYCKRGKWIGLYPRCVEAHMCRAPPAVPYAVAINRNFETSYDSEGLPFFPINAQITYECLRGYILDGSSIISCQSNGCWEPTDIWPTCRTKDNYFIELNNINAILISSATGAGVLGILLLACLVVACKKRKALARAVSLPTSTSGAARHAADVVNDHAVLLQHPDRLALIAFAEGVQNSQNNSLPSYDEATRDRSTLIQVSRLQIQRPHWPNLAVCRTSGRNRGSPNIDSGHHVARHGSFASHTPSMRSGGESMGSTETVTISEGSTNVTLDTASSHSAISQNPSCRGHCGSLASFDGCSVANTEGIPLLEESELEEIQGGTNEIDNPVVSDNTSSKISTHSAPLLSN